MCDVQITFYLSKTSFRRLSIPFQVGIIFALSFQTLYHFFLFAAGIKKRMELMGRINIFIAILLSARKLLKNLL